MNSKARRTLLIACVLAAGCSGEVVIVDGSGSAGVTSASGSTGTGVDGPRTIDVVDVSTGDDSSIVVLHNRADGTLVESWPASALPVAPTVEDGDLVTVVYPGNSSSVASSYRVEHDVTRIELSLVAASEPLECLSDGTKMHLDVHIPAIPGAVSATIDGAPWEHLEALELPADLDLDVSSCDGGTSAELFIHVDGPEGFLAFEYDILMFVPGATIPFTPTFQDQPRKAIVFDVDGTDGANQGGGFGYWLRDYAGYGWIVGEPGTALDVPDDSPFVFEANLIDVPHGRPFASAWAYFPPPPSACDDSALIERYGPIDAPIPFHVSALARPTAEGASFALDPEGNPADVVTREWTKGDASQGVWLLAEDPRTPRTAVFPELPSGTDHLFPEGEIAIHRITHTDIDGPEGYAAWAAKVPTTPLSVASTIRRRSVSYGCGL